MQLLKKFLIEEILKLEKVDKKFEFCVKEVLKQQKVLRFGKEMFCKHSANNSKISDSQTVTDFDQMKTILEKCPNIKCLQIRELVINKSLFKKHLTKQLSIKLFFKVPLLLWVTTVVVLTAISMK